MATPSGTWTTTWPVTQHALREEGQQQPHAGDGQVPGPTATPPNLDGQGHLNGRSRSEHNPLLRRKRRKQTWSLLMATSGTRVLRD